MFFCSRQLKVAEMGGRQERETARKRSAVDDQNWSKIVRSKKNEIFAILETNVRADGNQKWLPLWREMYIDIGILHCCVSKVLRS